MISLLLPTYILYKAWRPSKASHVEGIPLYLSRLSSAFHLWTRLSSEFGLVNLFGTSLGLSKGGHAVLTTTHHSMSQQPIHFSLFTYGGWSPWFCLHSSLTFPLILQLPHPITFSQKISSIFLFFSRGKNEMIRFPKWTLINFLACEIHLRKKSRNFSLLYDIQRQNGHWPWETQQKIANDPVNTWFLPVYSSGAWESARLEKIRLPSLSSAVRWRK